MGESDLSDANKFESFLTIEFDAAIVEKLTDVFLWAKSGVIFLKNKIQLVCHCNNYIFIRIEYLTRTDIAHLSKDKSASMI